MDFVAMILADQNIDPVFKRQFEPASALPSLLNALRRIARWELPATGRFHEDGKPMSYSWCYGSNGERDFMRQVAAEAIAKATGESVAECIEGMRAAP